MTISLTYKDIFVNQGSDFNTSIFVVNTDNNVAVNISNTLVSASIKTSYYTYKTTASFNVNLDTTNSMVYISLPSSVSANIRASRQYVYDIFLMDTDQIVTKLQEGIVYLNPQVGGFSNNFTPSHNVDSILYNANNIAQNTTYDPVNNIIYPPNTPTDADYANLANTANLSLQISNNNANTLSTLIAITQSAFDQINAISANVTGNNIAILG